jgi:single-stranded DNA-binding protein
MLDALIAGKIYGTVVERTSKGGNRFVTGKLKAAMRDESVFVNFISFREHVCAALLELADGASIAVSGELKVATYTAKDGTVKPSLDLTVHEILTEFHVSRRRKAMAAKDSGGTESEPAAAKPPQSAAPAQEDFNDDIPF